MLQQKKDNHLQWFKEEMKVSFADQTFRRSVPDALDFLYFDLKNTNFSHSKKICRFFNNTFDNFWIVLMKKPFKKLLSSSTVTNYFEVENIFEL